MPENPVSLRRRIQLGEDSSLELKEVRISGGKIKGPTRTSLADELAAFANTRGGTLVLGVEDNTRAIIGIPLNRLDQVEHFVLEVCNSNIEPPLPCHIYRSELPDFVGELQPVLRVEIPRGLYVHRSSGGYFYRQGSSKRQMSTQMLSRLFEQRSQARQYRFEEQAVPETTFSDLDAARLRHILGAAPDYLGTCKKMNLATEDESGHIRATVAGILMFSSSPHRWLPGAFIQAVCYRGTHQDTNYQVDAQDITGSLDEQVAGAMAFLRRNMSVAARKIPGRVETPQFSLRAVFEAVVNAVAHRDYAVHGSKIRLFLFANRLELYSPGPLPNSITVESIELRQSTRNELLTTLLAKCAWADPTGEVTRQFLMEKRGDGVPIIIQESQKLSGRRPEYRVLDGAEVMLTVYAASDPAH